MLLNPEDFIKQIEAFLKFMTKSYPKELEEVVDTIIKSDKSPSEKIKLLEKEKEYYLSLVNSLQKNITYLEDSLKEK